MGNKKRVVMVHGLNGTQVDHGWADLDNANKADGHYQREHPDLVDARERVQGLEREEIELIDRMIEEGDKYGFLSFHPCRDFPRYVQLQSDLFEARKEYDRLYKKYNGKNSEGTFTHTNTITNKVPKWEKSIQKA